MCLFPVVGHYQKRNLRVPILCQLSPCFFHLFNLPWFFLTCRCQTIVISDIGLRRPQQALESCILQLPFITLFPEIERIPTTAEPAPQRQLPLCCDTAFKNKTTAGVFKITHMTVQHHWKPRILNLDKINAFLLPNKGQGHMPYQNRHTGRNGMVPAKIIA